LQVVVEPIVIHWSRTFIAAAEAGKIGDLALAGGVVHERDKAEIGIGEDREEAGGRFRMGQFAAKVEEMIGAEEASGFGLVEGENAVGDEVAREAVEVAIDADADGIEDGGDAEAGDLRVVGDQGRERRPAGTAGLQMLFEVIGVEFDAAGEQIMTIEIDGVFG
jgi:hypothetical protein